MSETYNAILSPGDDDASRAFLFHAPDDPHTHAVTCNPLGANLPPLETVEDWVFEREFALGVREVLPINVAPEPVLRGLMADGYFVWSDRSNPKGTSQ